VDWRSLPDPFLPFLPVLSHLGPGHLFRLSSKAILLTALFALLFNRHVRAACLTIGSVYLLAILSSRIYFENNHLFVAVIFFLAGLAEPGRTPWLLRCQIALVYFSAGLNKLLDAGWRSGDFFTTWSRPFIHEKLYFRVEGWLPGRMLARLFSWNTIASELGLSFLLLSRWFVAAVSMGILFHTGLLFMTGRTFGMFYYAALASYLAFLEWPRSGVAVLYDGDCGFCTSTRRFFEAITLEPIAEWVPFQTAQDLHGIREEELKRRIHVFVDGRTYKGFAAIKTLLLYNPVVYFVAATILAAPEPAGFAYRRWLAALLWIAFAPVFSWIGEYVYEAIARNRHRLSRNATCGLPGLPANDPAHFQE
jgi:predicted DCC family thiol-disulfide oxidoreductase YuxK